MPLRSVVTSLPTTVDYGEDKVDYDSVGEGDEQRKGLVYQDVEMKGHRPLGCDCLTAAVTAHTLRAMNTAIMDSGAAPSRYLPICIMSSCQSVLILFCLILTLPKRLPFLTSRR